MAPDLKVRDCAQELSPVGTAASRGCAHRQYDWADLQSTSTRGARLEDPKGSTPASSRADEDLQLTAKLPLPVSSIVLLHVSAHARGFAVDCKNLARSLSTTRAYSPIVAVLHGCRRLKTGGEGSHCGTLSQGRCTPDTSRLAASLKSAESGQERSRCIPRLPRFAVALEVV
jgi:hypothetical protein